MITQDFKQINMLHRKGNAFGWAVELIQNNNAIDITGFNWEFYVLDVRGNILLTEVAPTGLSYVGTTQLAWSGNMSALEALGEQAFRYELRILDPGGNISIMSGKMKIVEATHLEGIEALVSGDGSLIQVEQWLTAPVIQITTNYTPGMALKADLVGGKVPLSQLPPLGGGGGGSVAFADIIGDPLDNANLSAQFAKYYDVSNPDGYITMAALGGYALESWVSAHFSTAMHAHNWADISGRPTTLAGYGITDAYPLSGNPSGFITPAALTPYATIVYADSRYAQLGHTHALTLTGDATGTGSVAGSIAVSIATFGAGTKGLVPASGGGTTNFLRADGTWAAPTASVAWGGITGSIASQTDLITKFADYVLDAAVRGGAVNLNARLNVISNFASPNAGGVISGKYYDNSFHGTNTTVFTGVTDNCDLAPYYTSVSMPITELGVSISTGSAGSNVKLVIYKAGTDGWPDLKVYETGDISTASGGFKFEALSFTFQSGVQYWVGIRYSGAPIIRAINLGSAVNLGLLLSTGNTYATIIRRSISYASAAPTSWAFVSTDLVAGVAPPSIRFRAA